MISKSQNLSLTDVLSSLGLSADQPNPGVYDGQWFGNGETIESLNPSTGKTLATVTQASEADVQRVLKASKAASKVWRKVPAPERGRVLRLIRNALDEKVNELGMLITYEMGKIVTEGRGEVVEFIDVADYAVGLSRSIGGTVLPSERNKHFKTEVSHPLGVVGVISAFNFPIAVSTEAGNPLISIRSWTHLDFVTAGLWLELFPRIHHRKRFHLETKRNHPPLRTSNHQDHHRCPRSRRLPWSALWVDGRWRQGRGCLGRE